MRSILLASIAALAFPACVQDISSSGTGTGSDTGSDTTGTGETGGGGSTPSIAAAVDQSTVSTELGKTVKLTYTVTSENGYAGTVTATAPTMTGWTITATPASATLAAGGTTTIELDVAIPTDATDLAPSIALGLSDGTNSTSVASTFTVAKQLTVNLDAAGSANGTHVTWPAKNAPLKIRSGTVVIFHNADTVQHEIHAGGGIAHESGELQAGADYKTAPVTSDATWYCHNHEAGGDSRGVVVE